MKSIFDKSFRYTSAAETDLKKVFARARKKLKDEELQREANRAEIEVKVSPIKQKAKA